LHIGSNEKGPFMGPFSFDPMCNSADNRLLSSSGLHASTARSTHNPH
jgi:hypothetical protein